MRRLDEILRFNQGFVENGHYEVYRTNKFPDKKIIVLSCMDTRLTQLLPKALNLQNGDAKFIKNAGAMVSHPFGSIMRSIIVAIYELKVEEIYVIGHHGCGMCHIKPDSVIEAMKTEGISEEILDTLKYSGIDLNAWLTGFDCVVESVTESVNKIANHPLVPKKIPVHGLIIDPDTGLLELVVDGYETKKVNPS